MALEGGYVVAIDNMPLLAYPVRKGQYGVVVRVLDNLGQDTWYAVRWYFDKPAEMVDADEVYAV